MTNQTEPPKFAISAPPAEPMAAAERAEHRQKLADQKLAKLGHAIAFLNNHLHRFGSRYTHDEPADDYANSVNESFPVMADVPDGLRVAFERALTSAAGFAAKYFESEELS